MSNRAVFFDRDGTLIEDMNYLRDPAGIKLMPGAVESVKKLREAGYRIIVITNQSGIARGMFTEETLEAIHGRMRKMFAEQGAVIDAIYYCPFLDGPEATVEKYRCDSDLRKPRPGMFLKAAKECNIDLSASWAIGDSDRDSQAGKAAGCRTIQMVPNARDRQGRPADSCVGSLSEALEHILRAEPATAPSGEDAAASSKSDKLLEEIVEHVRVWQRRNMMEDFTFAKFGGAIVQLVAIGAAFSAILSMLSPSADVLPSHRWLAAIYLQLLAMTLFMLHRNR